MTNDADEPQFDIAVVVVHGIGRQRRAETLLEWSEPLVRRLDYLARQEGGQAQVISSQLLPTDEIDASVVALVTIPDKLRQSILLTEARWADTFIAPRPQDLPSWAIRNGFRAGRRLGMLLFRNFTGTWSALGRELRQPVAVPLHRKDKTTPQLVAIEPISVGQLYLQVFVAYLGAIFATILSIVGLLALLIVGWIIPAIAVIATLLLVIVARIPVFNRWLQTPVVLLTDFIGDATVWTDQPVRAQAMKDSVKLAVQRASSRATRTIVIAHSQGAAVSARALFADDAPTIDHLVTIGGAVDLLHDTGWHATRRRTPDIVTAWMRREKPLWTNIWAGFDPVPAGPVSARGRDHRRSSASRWRAVDACSRRLTESWIAVSNEALGTDPKRLSFADNFMLPGTALLRKSSAVAGDEATRRRVQYADRMIATLLPAARQEMIRKHRLAPGPAERRVQNGGSVVSDHITYSQNVAQVIDPIARSVILADAVGVAGEAEKLAKNRSAAVKLLVIARVLGLILAAAVSPWLVSLVPWVSTSAEARELASGNALLSYLIEAVDSANLWSLIALSGAALVFFAIVAGFIRASWTYWVSDLEWKADRGSERTGLWHILPFAAVFFAVAVPGVFLGLRAITDILNRWLSTAHSGPPINLTSGELAAFTIVVLGGLVGGAAVGGEYTPLPEIRSTRTPGEEVSSEPDPLSMKCS